jgi:pimeloyl-ACP methyl ester carboxylesterase
MGYGPLNLTAGSYGTRAAQVFLRTYPTSVRTAYLGSVVPLYVATPLSMARTEEHELERLLSACEADEACHAAFPRVRDEFRAIAARLSAGVRVVPPGSDAAATLARGRVAEWFRSRLYRPADGAELPWLIHQAYAGNWLPITEGILYNARQMASALSVGLLLTITCREDIPFIGEDAVTAETQGTFLGDYRVREQMPACEHWPASAVPDGYRRPVHSAVPTMFVSGDSDAATPLWFTERVAPGFSNRVEIIARNQGHTEWSGCVERLYERFVREGSPRGIESRACGDIERPPFRVR